MKKKLSFLGVVLVLMMSLSACSFQGAKNRIKKTTGLDEHVETYVDGAYVEVDEKKVKETLEGIVKEECLPSKKLRILFDSKSYKTGGIYGRVYYDFGKDFELEGETYKLKEIDLFLDLDLYKGYIFFKTEEHGYFYYLSEENRNKLGKMIQEK